jgi:hypothetical protein
LEQKSAERLLVETSPCVQLTFAVIEITFKFGTFDFAASRLLGLDTLKLSFEDTGAILRQLTPGFESGEFRAMDYQAFPLERGPELYRQVHESKLKDKVVLTP